MTHIPYTGAGPAVLALLGGQVDAVASGPVDGGAADQGRQAARAGALGRASRWPRCPSVPSLKEAGYPVQFAQWSALFVPAGTPDDVVHEAARRGRARPRRTRRCVQTIARAGSPIEYLDAPEFQAYWDADAQAMTEAVRRIGKVE